MKTKPKDTLDDIRMAIFFTGLPRPIPKELMQWYSSLDESSIKEAIKKAQEKEQQTISK